MLGLSISKSVSRGFFFLQKKRVNFGCMYGRKLLLVTPPPYCHTNHVCISFAAHALSGLVLESEFPVEIIW